MRHFESLERRRLLATIQFAAIGDYGTDSLEEAQVASLVKSWNPDFIVTTGDNNYPLGEAETIDANIGKHYQEFIGNYAGEYGPGSPVNRFFPSMGNHDWYVGSEPYTNYFTLPGNERYYDFVRGPVHFFAIDSDFNEPDGITPDSIQGQWLQSKLATSTSPWQIVYFHHPSYSSGLHGSQAFMQWPFAQWGADLVLTGHDHTYERIKNPGDNLTYVVIGASGNAALYPFGEVPVAGSMVRHNTSHGALRLEAGDTHIRIRFIDTTGQTIDDHTLTRAAPVHPPVVSNIHFNGVPAHGSARSIAFTFSKDVAPPAASDLLLYNANTGATVNPSNFAVTYDAAARRAAWSFPGLAGGLLPEANYIALLQPTIKDLNGNALDGNADGVGGDARVVTFLQLRGDINMDGNVNHHDFAALHASFGQPQPSAADFNADNRVDFADFQILEVNFGRSVLIGAMTPAASRKPAGIPSLTSRKPIIPFRRSHLIRLGR